MSKDYVAGFLFDTKFKHVLLVKKQKPDWQAGKLNAIGGKIEDGESPIAAMRREFREETGLGFIIWNRLCVLRATDNNYGWKWRVCFFYATGTLRLLRRAKTMETEEIQLNDVSKIDYRFTIPNLEWLIPMAKSLASGRDRAQQFVVEESYHPQ